MPVIHVVIPFLNEESTLHTIVERLGSCSWPVGWTCRIILVDDGSASRATDQARAIAEDARHAPTMLIRHRVNRGKGAALRTGFQEILKSAQDEDLVGVQDADLEYDPGDLVTIIDALETTRPPAHAAFGNRWTGEDPSTIRRVHRLGNRMLTCLSNVLTGLSVSDMECCYKLIRIPMLRTIVHELDEDRFAIEPQLAATLARHQARVIEVPVSYEPRSFSQGKKIGLRDGVAAVAAIIREWFRTLGHRRRQA